MTEELLNQIALRYKIYFATTDLKDIIFTPKTVLPQGMSDYYFTHLRVKFPRKYKKEGSLNWLSSFIDL